MSSGIPSEISSLVHEERTCFKKNGERLPLGLPFSIPSSIAVSII